MKRIVGKLTSGVVAVIAVLLLVYAAWNWTASRALQRTWTEMRDQGLPTTVEAITPEPVPPEQNAAPLLNRAFAAMTRDAPETERYDSAIMALLSYALPDVGEPEDRPVLVKLNADQKQLVATQLADPAVTEVLHYLHRAAQKTHCNFGIDYSAGASMLLPHLSHLRQGVRLLALQAWMQADAGDLQAALATIGHALRLGELLKDEPILISQLVRMAVNETALRVLEDLQNRHPVEAFASADIAALLAQLDAQTETDRAALARAMDGERVLFGNWAFNRIIRGNMSADDLDSIGMNPGLALYANMLTRPWVKTDFRYYLLTMQEYRQRAQQPFHEVTRMRPLAESVPRIYLLTRSIMPALDKTCRQAAANRARVELARMSLLLNDWIRQNNGQPPASLDVLQLSSRTGIDPFTGSLLKYEAAPGKYVLYSLGPDQDDDGGMSPDTGSSLDANGDIAWVVALP